MFNQILHSRYTKLLVVLACAFALKLHYSMANPNELRWILAPTKALVQLVSGTTFTFESYAGYLSADRTFLIAGACAGVNFLITAFLMLSLRKLWLHRAEKVSWTFLPLAAVNAYVATLLANTIRISVALQVKENPINVGWLDRDQFHRLEGICVYFGFLLLLFVISERGNREKGSSLVSQLLFPLLVYYATTLGFPLANGAFRQGINFWEHSLFVLLLPLILLVPFPLFRKLRRRCQTA